jgi:hypothetical protein
VKNLAGLYTLVEGLLILILNFAIYSLILLSSVDLRDLIGKNVDSRSFKNCSRCLSFVTIDILLIGQSRD